MIVSFKATVSEILREFKSNGVLLECSGDSSTVITRISAVEDCGPGDLVFMDKMDYFEIVHCRRPSAVVTTPALRAAIPATDTLTILTASNVGLAHALIKKRYGDRDFGLSGWTGIHPSSVVHETAIIGEGTIIEPKAVIGPRVVIGRNSRIMSGVVIESDVVIGDETVIHPNVVIGWSCRIGNQADIGSGSVIGSEGYGFAQDAKRKSYPIPQTGIVVIEDRVRVGANNCIDRATYKETRIGAGTKLDNLCHVAHNVQIGQDCLLTSMFCVAGSTTIGDRVIASGQTGILDHMKICNDVVLLHRAGVTKDIEQPGAYAGLPHQPLSDYMKNMAAFRTIGELRKRLSQLEKE
ncbi:MAG: UDP-3-O-(3-hydroxymyristoyl)glucosamine N-acyltransferase [Bdellovibrionaceae bacterium]|nr:UDP-3-O-(3-hydroxymyristoyl)glucosamine N-acyltransferase [Pseudobdellovibrionaceae bacterium]